MSEYFEDRESYGADSDAPDTPIEGVALDQPIHTLSLRSPLCLEETRSVSEAIEMMRENRNGSVLVTSGGRLVGIFTERDVLTKIALEAVELRQKPLAEVMRSEPETLSPEAA